MSNETMKTIGMVALSIGLGMVMLSGGVGFMMLVHYAEMNRPKKPQKEPEKVTRTNYAKIGQHCHMREVEDILGFGVEDRRAEFTIMAHWTSRNGRTTIRIIFENNVVVTKSIVGD